MSGAKRNERLEFVNENADNENKNMNFKKIYFNYNQNIYIKIVNFQILNNKKYISFFFLLKI